MSGVRQVSRALGSKEKGPSEIERRNAEVARKSLVAAATIRQGELFTTGNLVSKRPGTGLSPLNYWSLLGTPAQRDYAVDELIDDEVGLT